MSTLQGGCNPNVSFTLTGQVGTNPSGQVPQTMGLAGQFAPGAAADQVNWLHSRTYNFAASTPQTIDLTALTDVMGTAFSFAAVRWLMYRIQATNAAFVVTVGGAGTNEWNGWLTSGSKALWYPSSALNSGYTIQQAPSATGMPVTGTSRFFKEDGPGRPTCRRARGPDHRRELGRCPRPNTASTIRRLPTKSVEILMQLSGT